MSGNTAPSTLTSIVNMSMHYHFLSKTRHIFSDVFKRVVAYVPAFFLLKHHLPLDQYEMDKHYYIIMML